MMLAMMRIGTISPMALRFRATNFSACEGRLVQRRKLNTTACTATITDLIPTVLIMAVPQAAIKASTIKLATI